MNDLMKDRNPQRRYFSAPPLALLEAGIIPVQQRLIAQIALSTTEPPWWEGIEANDPRSCEPGESCRLLDVQRVHGLQEGGDGTEGGSHGSASSFSTYPPGMGWVPTPTHPSCGPTQ